MKQTLILLIIAAVLLMALPVRAHAAAAADIDLTCAEQDGDQYTVTVYFTDIPAQNGVEYAQIRLTGSSGAYRIEEDSLRLLEKGDILLTLRHDPIADSLLVLIEPKTNGFRGIGSGGVFTFTLSRVRETNQDPGFTLEAILILKDGADITTMPIEYAPEVTSLYNEEICAELGITPLEGYEKLVVEE